MKAAVRALSLFLVLPLPLSGTAAPPFQLQGPGVHASDFRLTVFASGLNFPKGMQELSDGSLLIATSDPTPGSKSFYSSVGTLVRLVDSDLDGVADGPPSVLFTGLAGSLSGLKVSGPLVFVASTGHEITVLRLGKTPAAPLKLEGKIVFSLPSSWLHPPSDLAVREAPDQPGSYELFFQLGSKANFAASTQTVPVSGLVSGALEGDSIYRVTITDLGSSVTGSSVTRIARGLRNPAGYAFHPSTGDLYFEDNGIDGLSDPNEPLSADKLNVIPFAAIGGEVEYFGFPDNYTAYRSGMVVGGAGIQPVATFEPLPDPFTGEESEGPSEITFAPPAFPEGLNQGIFIGFHGKFNLGGIQNEENALVYVEPETGQYFHLVRSREPAVGHLDGLLSTLDSLYLADLTSGGSVSNGAGQGVIYQLQAIQGPRFLRGDSNGDGVVDVSDPVATLEYLFLGREPLPCFDAADANDDGEIDISDPLAVLFSLFEEARKLPPPSDGPGLDPTPDSLGCS
jgi:glucose/arabinose dehydrogenase